MLFAAITIGLKTVAIGLKLKICRVFGAAEGAWKLERWVAVIAVESSVVCYWGEVDAVVWP
jgi:hypothetical protein